MEAAALGHFVSGLDKATKVIIVSNRQPWFHERVAERIRAFRPASGLVKALEPIIGKLKLPAHRAGLPGKERTRHDCAP